MSGDINLPRVGPLTREYVRPSPKRDFIVAAQTWEDEGGALVLMYGSAKGRRYMHVAVFPEDMDYLMELLEDTVFGDMSRARELTDERGPL